MIISASRRTDIPAFYSDWFINRVRAGFLLTKNPFNAHQVRRVSLSPSDVDVIVFWTRNPEKLIPFFPELDQLGYRYYFQFTITGYPRTLEKSVPNPHRAIQIFSHVSQFLGAERVVWRYDPVLLSNQVDIAEHKRLFSKIAELLRGKTRRVVISFADLYKKTEINLKKIDGLQYQNIVENNEALLDLVLFMADVAKRNEMEIYSCAEELDLASAGILHGKCIDDDLIKKVFGISVLEGKDKGQRAACGCVKSIDIGEYNTCLHGCSYCYATYSAKAVENNRRKHDPNSPFLIGQGEELDVIPPESSSAVQGSLF